MIDIHSHILPGIDDGPDTWEESLEIARMAEADGVKTMVATPHMAGHYDCQPDDVLRLVDEANDRFKQEHIGVTIVPGAEVFLSFETPEALRRRELLTYGNQGKYMLVEWSTSEHPPYLEETLFQCQLQRVVPVIAHVERYDIADRLDQMTQWFQRGILLQVNAISFNAAPSRRWRKNAEALIAKGLVHFVASDAHSPTRRPPGLSKAYQRVKAMVGPAYADLLFRENPRRLLNGEEVLCGKPAPRRSWRRLLPRFR